MTDVELVTALTQLPITAFMAFLYLRERSRVMQVTERHIEDLRQLSGMRPTLDRGASVNPMSASGASQSGLTDA